MSTTFEDLGSSYGCIRKVFQFRHACIRRYHKPFSMATREEDDLSGKAGMQKGYVSVFE